MNKEFVRGVYTNKGIFSIIPLQRDCYNKAL